MRTLIALAVLVIAAPASAGSLHDTDVILEVVEGRVVTNRVADSAVVPERVFDADAISFFGNIVTDDPGFNAALGAFPPFTVLSLDLVAPLTRWNGDGFDALDPAFFLEIEFNNQTAQSPVSEGVTVPGPLMNATQFGDLHNHADHFLEIDAAPGVYLGAFRFSSTTLDPSEPFYFVYRWEPTTGDLPAAEAEQQLAIEWVRQNIVVTPCPTDFDADGATGSADLATLLAAWGTSAADLDADAITASSDLAILLAAWGACK